MKNKLTSCCAEQQGELTLLTRLAAVNEGKEDDSSPDWGNLLRQIAPSLGPAPGQGGELLALQRLGGTSLCSLVAKLRLRQVWRVLCCAHAGPAAGKADQKGMFELHCLLPPSYDPRSVVLPASPACPSHVQHEGPLSKNEVVAVGLLRDAAQVEDPLQRGVAVFEALVAGGWQVAGEACWGGRQEQPGRGALGWEEATPCFAPACPALPCLPLCSGLASLIACTQLQPRRPSCAA